MKWQTLPCAGLSNILIAAMGEQLALADINAGFDRLATGNSLRDVVVF